jgi:glutamate dehydrogenase (NAD(P)+)
VVQGFGNVGSHAMRFLQEQGVKIIGISDVSTGLHNPNGLDVDALEDHVRQHGNLQGYGDAEAISNADLLELACDILAPCALQNQITAENAQRIHCKILAEGANGPTSLEADRILTEKGVFIIPDILGNAGGVTVSYFEWVQDTQKFTWTLSQINERLHEILVGAFARTLERSTREGVDMRTAAMIVGIERVASAKALRGLYP